MKEVEFLNAVVDYIRRSECAFDGVFDEELDVTTRDMPPLYAEAVKKLSEVLRQEQDYAQYLRNQKLGTICINCKKLLVAVKPEESSGLPWMCSALTVAGGDRVDVFRNRRCPVFEAR